MSTVAVLCRAAQPLLDGALDLDAEARARVRRLDGAVLEVAVTGLGWRVYAVAEGERLRLTDEPPAAADATIAGPPASLARLGALGGTRVLFDGSLRVSGDVGAAKGFKRLFDTLDPDWEEALARAFGDVPAHQAARLLRQAGAEGRRAGVDRVRDLRAWLIDEIEALPARHEVTAWMDRVDRIRADADRLAARVERLERRHRDGS
jgi:ubiquinone biosynthesis protein UbiJ